MRPARLSAQLLFVAAVLWSCTGSGGLGIPSPSPISQVVGPAGAAIEVTAQGDPVLAGTTLLIPRGALERDTVITVSHGAEQAGPDETALGPSVRFSPDGLAFAKPATLGLPFRPASLPDGSEVVVALTSASQKTEVDGAALTVDPRAATVATDIVHFTDYQALGRRKGVRRDGGSDGGRDGGSDGGPDGGADGGGGDGGLDLGANDGGLDLGDDGPP